MRGSAWTRVVAQEDRALVYAAGRARLVAAGSAGAVTITSWVGGKAAVPQVVTAAGNCPGTVITINGTGFVNDGGITERDDRRRPGRRDHDRLGHVLRTGRRRATDRSVVGHHQGLGTATSAAHAIVYPCQATGVAGEKPSDSLR